MERTRLGRDDWLRAARLALLRGGPAAVRVEILARRLHVTKGSFYWHFKDRGDLLEALLREWEEEKSFLKELLNARDLRSSLDGFFDELRRRVGLSERGEWPSDAAIFAWATVSPPVAKRANREERRRVELLRRLTRDADRAEYIYMAYLGFLVRRRRVPGAAKNFSLFARMSAELLLGGAR